MCIIKDVKRIIDSKIDLKHVFLLISLFVSTNNITYVLNIKNTALTILLTCVFWTLYVLFQKLIKNNLNNIYIYSLIFCFACIELKKT